MIDLSYWCRIYRIADREENWRNYFEDRAAGLREFVLDIGNAKLTPSQIDEILGRYGL